MRGAFSEALLTLRLDVDGLGGMAEDAVVRTVAALLGDRRTDAQAVIDGDDLIDARFLELEERAYALVAMQAPVATDLRFLMSALRVMSDYEKAADRAVAIAKVAMAEWERESKTLNLLGRMADMALSLLKSAREAWLALDLEIASELKRRDVVLDGCYRSLVAHLLSQTGDRSSSLVLYAYAAGRNLERIADHAVIVGERVSYLLTGDPSALAAEIG